MGKKKVITLALIVLCIGLVGGYIISSNIGNKAKTNDKVEDESNKKTHELVVSGYSFETTESNTINKKFDGTRLESFVTVALQQEEFNINLEGINSESKVFIIDPNTGEMTSMQSNNEVFSITTALDKDITYGIIVDYQLVGSIRVVEDLENINQDELFKDILVALGCGL